MQQRPHVIEALVYVTKYAKWDRDIRTIAALYRLLATCRALRGLGVHKIPRQVSINLRLFDKAWKTRKPLLATNASLCGRDVAILLCGPPPKQHNVDIALSDANGIGCPFIPKHIRIVANSNSNFWSDTVPTFSHEALWNESAPPTIPVFTHSRVRIHKSQALLRMLPLLSRRGFNSTAIDRVACCVRNPEMVADLSVSLIGPACSALRTKLSAVTRRNPVVEKYEAVCVLLEKHVSSINRYPTATVRVSALKREYANRIVFGADGLTPVLQEMNAATWGMCRMPRKAPHAWKRKPHTLDLSSWTRIRDAAIKFIHAKHDPNCSEWKRKYFFDHVHDMLDCFHNETLPANALEAAQLLLEAVEDTEGTHSSIVAACIVSNAITNEKPGDKNARRAMRTRLDTHLVDAMGLNQLESGVNEEEFVAWLKRLAGICKAATSRFMAHLAEVVHNHCKPVLVAGAVAHQLELAAHDCLPATSAVYDEVVKCLRDAEKVRRRLCASEIKIMGNFGSVNAHTLDADILKLCAP